MTRIVLARVLREVTGGLLPRDVAADIGDPICGERTWLIRTARGVVLVFAETEDDALGYAITWASDGAAQTLCVHGQL